MARGDHPSFPLGTNFHYLNEGAANIVYRMSVPMPTPPPSIIEEYEDGEPAPSDEDMTPTWYKPFQSKYSI
jgi:inositol-pentakisphosphate 2-kinase